MSFTELLLETAYKKKQLVMSKLKYADNIVIWGTGIAAGIVYDKFKELKKDIKFFVESSQSVPKQKFKDKAVKDITDIVPSDFVIIAANFNYAIHKKLEAAGIENYMYLDPHWFKNAGMDSFDRFECLLRENEGKINQAYELLEDPKSRKSFQNVLLHRAVHDITLLEEIYEEPAYFGNDVIGAVDGVFVDCGAFQGDTLQQFLSQGRTEYKYYAIEPEEYNYGKLVDYCRKCNVENVVCLNLGVWDKKEKLYFCGEQGADTGKILPEGSASQIVINADTIDHIVGGENVNFIKMDIEGAEINALLGGMRVIQQNRPALAVSAYHELEHLWEIPLLLKSFYRGYRIYFRHHSWNMSDTLCYAIADK